MRVVHLHVLHVEFFGIIYYEKDINDLVLVALIVVGLLEDS